MIRITTTATTPWNKFLGFILALTIFPLAACSGGGGNNPPVFTTAEVKYSVAIPGSISQDLTTLITSNPDNKTLAFTLDNSTTSNFSTCTIATDNKTLNCAYKSATSPGSDNVTVVTNNVSKTIVIEFTADVTPPTVTGVTDGANYNSDVTITFSDGTATLNGAAFTSGSTVSAEGAYTLIVTDSAGNKTTVNFSIDKTAPVVTGVTNNGIYNTNITPVFTGTATLNGAAFTSGTTISAEGTYTLVITDAANNSSTYHFTVDKTAPTISITNKQAVSLTTAGSQWVCDITFNEAIAQTPDATNFRLTGNDPIFGEVVVTSTSVALVSGNTYRISADFKGNNWESTTPTTWNLYIGNNKISDLAGNFIAGATLATGGTVNP